MNYNLLEKIRKDKKISQEELSKIMGLSASTYKKNIANRNMTIEVLEKASEILGVSPKIFFEEEINNTYLSNKNINNVSEPISNYNNNEKRLIEEIINDLREQLKIKDDQIKFLQHLIEEKL